MQKCYKQNILASNLFPVLLSVPSCPDCLSYAVTRWKSTLVPWPIPVEPDRWKCPRVRAVKDPNGTGQLPGWHVHGGAWWGERVIMTAAFLIFVFRNNTQHLLSFFSWNISFEVFRHSYLSTLAVLAHLRIQTLGLFLVGFHKNTTTASTRISPLGRVNQNKKALMSNDL